MIGTLPSRLVGALVLAPSWAVAAAFLVKGHGGTGDGFSAALTAGTGVLIHHLVLGRTETGKLAVVRHASRLTAAGLGLVLLTVFLPVAVGDAPLTHHPAPQRHPPSLGALELHTGLLMDVGVFAVVLGLTLAAIETLTRAADRIQRREEEE